MGRLPSADYDAAVRKVVRGGRAEIVSFFGARGPRVIWRWGETMSTALAERR
jgi:hypothetical protein